MKIYFEDQEKNGLIITYVRNHEEKRNIVRRRKRRLRNRSSHPEVFCKKGVLRDFAKFIGKH